MRQNKHFSLQHEFFRKRTLFSFGLSFLLIAFFLSQTTFSDLSRYVAQADLAFLLLAFSAHYSSYLIRGWRWRRMLRIADFSGTTIDLAKIIFLFQSVDCVLPAKVGDVYGAHLMKLNFGLSRSFALGSIFLWRVIDLIVVTLLATGAAFVLFESQIPPELMSAMKVVGPGLAVLLAGMGFLFHAHHWWSAIVKSARLQKLLASFREGLRLNWNMLPALFISTTLIWGLEALRLYFICKAMAVDLNVSAVVFITLCAVLFTAIPFTPSGLGAVELGMVKLLALVGITSPVAYPLILWDRFISHWSQILLGVVFVIFSKPIQVKIWQSEEGPLAPAEKSLVHS
jgi:uncharacterized protein (TIRG00374 family)